MISCVESNNTYIYKFAITPNFISIIRNHPVVPLYSWFWHLPFSMPRQTVLSEESSLNITDNSRHFHYGPDFLTWVQIQTYFCEK